MIKPENLSMIRDAVIVAVGNCVTSVFAGFVIFGIIGFMAWEQNTSVSDVSQDGIQIKHL